MTRCWPALLVALALAGCAASAEPEAAAPTPLQREITGLVDQMARLHPDVDHEVPLPELRAEAADLAERAPQISRDELLVGLLRLTTLGERDGHGGHLPARPGARRSPFTFFPLRVHDFADGVHVVADVAGGAHVGKRVTAIDGVPLAEVVTAVRPLIPRDNASTVRLLLPEYLVCAEVLRGLGIVRGAATYAFADGSEVTLEAGQVRSAPRSRRCRDSRRRCSTAGSSSRSCSRRSSAAARSTSATTRSPRRRSPWSTGFSASHASRAFAGS